MLKGISDYSCIPQKVPKNAFQCSVMNWEKNEADGKISLLFTRRDKQQAGLNDQPAAEVPRGQTSANVSV